MKHSKINVFLLFVLLSYLSSSCTSHNYVNYIPISQGIIGLQTDTSLLSETHLHNIQQVLDFYNEDWKLVEGQVKVAENIDEELLWNYTNKAEDYEWMKSQGLDVMEPKLAPVIFLVDVSSSMLAQDITPNRMEALKNMLHHIISKKPNHQQMSIVAFSASAFVVTPFVAKKEVLYKAIDDLSIGMNETLPEGTAIGDGLAMGLWEINQMSTSEPVDMVLLTDGESNMGTYSVEQALQMALASTVSIHPFRVGKNGRTKAPIAQRSSGDYVFGWTTVDVDETDLENIMLQTGCPLKRLDDDGDFSRVQSLKDLLSPCETVNPIITEAIEQDTLQQIWDDLDRKNQEFRAIFFENKE